MKIITETAKGSVTKYEIQHSVKGEKMLFTLEASNRANMLRKFWVQVGNAYKKLKAA